MATLIVTIVGEDRPGLVGRISDVVRQNSGNWLESRMSHLSDQFAGIVQIEAEPESIEALTKDLKSLEIDGVSVTVKIGGVAAATGGGRVFSLSVVGNDRPGIVREVTRVLGSHNVNVEELSTRCEPAPHAGGHVFRAEASLQIPSDLTPESLQAELEAIAADLMIDLTAE